jgi:hypothetical protein
MASMETSENRARLLAEVDEVLRATPVEVVLEAVRKAGGRTSPSAGPEIGEAGPPRPRTRTSGTSSTARPWASRRGRDRASLR